MKNFSIVISILVLFISCATSNSTTSVSSRTKLSEYKYVVFGKDDNDGSAELADIMLDVENLISEKLLVINKSRASALIEIGEKVVSPRINIKSEKWDGGHTYITISFYDFDTNQNIAVIKSSGIGLTVSHDQKIAFKAIKKELDKTFP